MIQSDYKNILGFEVYNIKIYKVLVKKPINGFTMC